MGFNCPMSTPDPLPHVVVCGPASWNHLISLDRLPEPVPHMQFAESAWHTVGGTSAGKAAISPLSASPRCSMRRSAPTRTAGGSPRC